MILEKASEFIIRSERRWFVFSCFLFFNRRKFLVDDNQTERNAKRIRLDFSSEENVLFSIRRTRRLPSEASPLDTRQVVTLKRFDDNPVEPDGKFQRRRHFNGKIFYVAAI